MEGPLCKWTNVVKGWQYRYFTLDTSQALLSYFTSKEKMLKGDRRGCVRLKGAVIGIDEEYEYTFTITVDQKIFHFQAQDSEERLRWVTALEDTILRHSHKRKAYSKRLDSSKVPTIKDFDNKLVETDAYLQLLNNQLRLIDEKISGSGKEAEETVLVDIKVKTLTLIDAIKQTILLLQRAKNDFNPVNGIISSSSKDSDHSNLSEQGSSDQASCNSTTNIRLTSVDSANVNARLNDNNCLSVQLNTVPETSYSSSEDEGDDYFFDAEEHTFASEKRLSFPASPAMTGSASPATLISGDRRQSSLSIAHHQSQFSDDYSQYDACYEDDDDENELDAMENQGSVISHLISQVKIGMDLTKVALPTFILERRSLLEMYADFFAHPDLFISIGDFESPEQRFVQAVRWYLSAFHAGRKSSVAKKPYNPILGEVFKCFWNVPNYESKKSKKSENGPVPWAKTENLTFVAEQVSHHPPISAFYAEHIEKRIMCMAHIYTKSKFLGLSVGVHNIGQGSIYLLDRGEEYVCTFPSAYGRSILSVPWMELGGSVSVTCSQTGYKANIDFLTKPFYGGKKNKISGQITGPSGKVVMTLAGEWNGTMTFKSIDGKSETYVNTKEMPIVKKQVKPIREQENYESRHLWKEVTMALKTQNVSAATAAKCAIEQKQRELVRERSEKGIKWENRAFKNLGDNWTYKDPLTSRQISENI